MNKCILLGHSIITAKGEGSAYVESALENDEILIYPSKSYQKDSLGIGALSMIDLSSVDYYKEEFLREKVHKVINKIFNQATLNLNHVKCIDVVYVCVGTSEFRMTKDQEGVCLSQEQFEKIIKDELKKKCVELRDESSIIFSDNVCASTSVCIGLASEKIKSGDIENSLIVGLDFVTDLVLIGLNMLGALSKGEISPELSCRPFSETRTGFVRSEALGAVLLTSEEVAIESGEMLQVEILGSGQSSDAKHITAGCEMSIGIRSSITKALLSANLKPKDIDLIKAHGTGTLVNDRNEASAIFDIFQDTPVVSLKGQFGHSAASCGVLELIICNIFFKKHTIYPTKNAIDLDRAFKINLINRSKADFKLRHILMNTFGFGGNNSSIILKNLDV